VKTLYKKNNFGIYVYNSESVSRFGIVFTSQVPVCGIIDDNKKIYKNKENELNLSFGKNTLSFYWVK